MYYLQNRYYDPTLGRFVSADKLQIIRLGAVAIYGKNLYQYCFNNSVNGSDHSGNWQEKNIPIMIAVSIAICLILHIMNYGNVRSVLRLRLILVVLGDLVEDSMSASE